MPGRGEQSREMPESDEASIFNRGLPEVDSGGVCGWIKDRWKEREGRSLERLLRGGRLSECVIALMPILPAVVGETPPWSSVVGYIIVVVVVVVVVAVDSLEWAYKTEARGHG